MVRWTLLLLCTMALVPWALYQRREDLTALGLVDLGVVASISTQNGGDGS